EPGRYFQDQAIARVAVAALTQTGHPAPAQLQQLARLATTRHLQRGRAAQDRHFDLGAQGQLWERQRDLAIEIGAVAGEERVLADAHAHAEIPGGPAVQPVVAGAPAAHGHAVVDAGRNADRHEMLDLGAALTPAVTTRAGVDLALSATLRTRPRHGDRAQARSHLALAPARFARDR